MAAVCPKLRRKRIKRTRGIDFGDVGQRRERAVTAAVVDEQDLVAAADGIESGVQRRIEMRDALDLVVERDDDRHLDGARRRPLRGRSPTRSRSRERCHRGCSASPSVGGSLAPRSAKGRTGGDPRT
jgi:hypothetical protein